MYCIHTECSSRCVDVWKLTQKSSFFFLVWVPIFDGEFITDTPKNQLESGKINQKDVMIGVTKDEGTTMFGTVLFKTQAFQYTNYSDLCKSDRYEL